MDIFSILIYRTDARGFVVPYDHGAIHFFSLQLYSSTEFGRRWQLVQEGVVPNRFYW